MTKTRVSPRLMAWIAVTVGVAVVAYLIGHHGSSSTTTLTGPGIAIAEQGGGSAYVRPYESSTREPVGTAYPIPGEVSWSDSSGELHSGGWPPCLPVGKTVRVKSIEVVQRTGTVVWVQC
jgi:hypothetical protein